MMGGFGGNFRGTLMSERLFWLGFDPPTADLNGLDWTGPAAVGGEAGGVSQVPPQA